MRWSDIEDGAWRGIRAEVDRDELPPRPAWRTEVARGGRARVVAGDSVRWWARQDQRWRSITLLRGEALTPEAAVVPPVRASDLRACAHAPGTVAWWRHWSRWFLRALIASPRSVMHPGAWWATPLESDELPWLPVLDGARPRSAPSVRWSSSRRALRRVDGPPWREATWDENWCLHGSEALLPMRPASPPDRARVKSWRKRAREGTLPPVLVHFVSALDMHALLDGHDRLVAAREEGVAIPWLRVNALRFDRFALDPGRQAGVVAEVQRRSDANQPLPTSRVNELYLQAFDDRPWPRAVCVGRAVPGGAARWDAEVRARLDALGLSREGPLLRA
ncbi:MAG: hypothetical protein R3A48_19820 [Polyangiales bacterium]